MLLLIAAGYWSVQIAEGTYYRELADNNRLRKLMIEAPRGLILDRYGRPLVENTPSYSLLLDRSLTHDLEASLDFAATILAKPRAELTQTLEDLSAHADVSAGPHRRGFDSDAGGTPRGRAPGASRVRDRSRTLASIPPSPPDSALARLFGRSHPCRLGAARQPLPVR